MRAALLNPAPLPPAQPQDRRADDKCDHDSRAADGEARKEAELVNQVTQDWGQYSSAFHVAKKVKTEHCGAVFCRCLVNDICLRYYGGESHDRADGSQHDINTESVRYDVEQVNHDAGRKARGYDYRHAAKAVRDIATKWPRPEYHGKHEGYRSRRRFLAGAKSVDQEKRDKGNDGHYQCHCERAQYNHGYQAALMPGSEGNFRFGADVPGHCFLGWHAFPQYDVEYNADADAGNSQRDERPAPAQGGGNTGGDERYQKVAEAAADHVKAECPAAVSWLYYGRYHSGGGGMITAPQYAHQHQASEQYNIVGRHTDQYSGGAHADDTDGEQDTRPEAVGKPSRRQLADTVDYAESRYDESGASVIQGKFVANIGQ